MIESRRLAMMNCEFIAFKDYSRVIKVLIQCIMLGGILSLTCCHRSLQPSSSPARMIYIEDLSVLDLSEDRLPFSTHNDEILFIVQTIEIKNGLPLILQDTAFENLLFDTAQVQHSLNLLLSPQTVTDSTYFIFSLIELDGENGTEEIKSTIRQEVAAGTFQKERQHRRLNKLLKYDDFLGWQLIPVKSIEAGDVRIVSFKGLQIFDRFEYQLKISGQ